MKEIAIITGGDSAEYDISIQSADVVLKNLDTTKYVGTIVHIKDKKWIFGNIAMIQSEIFNLIEKHQIKYSFVEFDYKFCKYRNPALYEMVEGDNCEYSETDLGKKIQNFINNAESIFFMSKRQKDIYETELPGIKSDNAHVLSSIFDEEFFDKIESLENKKSDKWVVLGSDSWVKGTSESEAW